MSAAAIVKANRRSSILVIGGFAPSLIGFREALLRALIDRGHEVTACAPSAPSAIVDALADIGVSYEDVPIQPTSLNPMQDVRALCALVAVVRKIKPDMVLGYTVKPVIFGSLAARFTDVPNCYSMITGVGYGFAGRGIKARCLRHALRLLYLLALTNNNRVFFQNPDDLALFQRLGLVRRPDQAVMINGSGVDVAAFQLAPLPDTVCFLLIARLVRSKGVREYVEAARIIKARHPGVSFQLVGRIDDHPSAIARRDLENWTRHGYVEYLGVLQDVRPAIAKSSVYVLPSYREGTPRSVLEAMAMGRPIVTTDAPGCRETVQEGVNGYLVPVHDVAALVAALERFIANPKLVATMGRESRRIAVEKYDVHKVNSVILDAMGLD